MKGIAVKLLIVVFSLLGLLKFFETSMTFPLDPTVVQPEQVGLTGVEVVTLTTEDGNSVVVWLHAGPPDAPMVVYFQGNAGNLGNRAERFKRFTRQGFGWAALAYRGSNGSTGTPSEAPLMADAAQLIALLQDRDPDRPLIYYGESLGTGIVTQLATTHPPAKLVLEAPYTSIPDAAVFGTAPASLAVLFKNQFRTIDHIADVTAPLLILHGTEDQVIPFAHGQQVYQAAASPDKTLLQLDGIGHGNVWTVPAQAALWRFLRKR